MKIGEALEKDIITAMKARDEHKLTTLRMVKSAFKGKEIDKREGLTDADEAQMLTTLIKQRRESIQQFVKGGRPELAEKEQAEIAMIEGYLPQSASEDEVRTVVHGAIAHMAAGGGETKLGPKDMGAVMKVAKQRILADGLRVDGKVLSDMIQAELAKQ